MVADTSMYDSIFICLLYYVYIIYKDKYIYKFSMMSPTDNCSLLIESLNVSKSQYTKYTVEYWWAVTLRSLFIPIISVYSE